MEARQGGDGFGSVHDRSLRYQSKSELSLWYHKRVGDLKGRVRRLMIIALARKLVIALWRYVETGKVPTGAIVTA
jgi:transposase